MQKYLETLQTWMGAGDVSLVKFYFDKWENADSDTLNTDFDTLNQGVLVTEFKNYAGLLRKIKFIGVRNIELKTGAYNEIKIIGLAVEDMSNSQWPGVNIRVYSEDEIASLAFYCSDIEFEE